MRLSADTAALVQGTIRDRTKVTANINGVAVAVDSATGAFSQRVRLRDGMNFLTLTATDAAGNATTVVRQVTRDATPPTLTVTAPSEGLITRNGTIGVSGAAQLWFRRIAILAGVGIVGGYLLIQRRRSRRAAAESLQG